MCFHVDLRTARYTRATCFTANLEEADVLGACAWSLSLEQQAIRDAGAPIRPDSSSDGGGADAGAADDAGVADAAASDVALLSRGSVINTQGLLEVFEARLVGRNCEFTAPMGCNQGGFRGAVIPDAGPDDANSPSSDAAVDATSTDAGESPPADAVGDVMPDRLNDAGAEASAEPSDAAADTVELQ